MFRTKKDIDKHVRSTLLKLRENEKNERSYRISGLYYSIGEYTSALEYIQRYLTINDKNAAAYRVLGQCYEKLKRPDKQLWAYQRSLELDKTQTDLLIEVCKLLQSDELGGITPAKARYLYELAELRKLQNDANLNLKLKLLSDEGHSAAENSPKLTSIETIEQLIRQIIELLALLKDDVADVRSKVYIIEKQLSKQQSDVDSVRSLGDYFLLDDNVPLNSETYNVNHTFCKNIDRNQKSNYQSTNVFAAQQQPQQLRNTPFNTQQAAVAAEFNNSFNMNAFYSNFYGQMPFNPYQVALANAFLATPKLNQGQTNIAEVQLQYHNDIFNSNYNLQHPFHGQQFASEVRAENSIGFHQPLNQSQLPYSPQISQLQHLSNTSFEYSNASIGGDPVAATTSTTRPTAAVAENSIIDQAPTAASLPFQNQWNSAFNKARLEKIPTFSIDNPSSNPLLTQNSTTTSKSYSLSVTIPSEHLKSNNAFVSQLIASKTNPTITAAQQNQLTQQTEISKTATTMTKPPLAQEQTSIFENISQQITSTPIASPSAPVFSEKLPIDKPKREAIMKIDATKFNPFAGFTFGKVTNDSSSSTKMAFRNIGQSLHTTNALVATGKVTNDSSSTKANLSRNKNKHVANTSAGSATKMKTKDKNEDDYVPNAHFEPAISLPDLIEVTTGEENEIVLFEHRAKLLRYVKETKEWKERGIGNIKVMANKDDPNKVRLLMRREHVHKLCCNQFLNKDTKFTKFPKNENSMSWYGQDYSENELKVEMLAIRFKTGDICKRFHDVILNAQRNMSDEVKRESASVIAAATSTKRVNGNNAVAKESNQNGFGDQFKAKAGSWTCDGCYLTNQGTDKKCAVCDTLKDKDTPASDESIKSTWTKSTFTFGAPILAGPSTLESKEYTFVSKAISSVKQKSPKKPQNMNSTSGNGVENIFDDKNVEDDDDEEEEEENNGYFTPVISMPDKVDVRTGEENENVLYMHRAKLFRFKESEWRERGLGDVKILQHKQTGRMRVVMRRERILKICLNHTLTHDIEYKPKDSKSWYFVVNDYSDGKVELEQFCLRFKTDDIAQEFKQAVDGVTAKKNGNANEHGNIEMAKSKTSHPSKQSIEENQKIVELQLPANFFGYKNKEKCAGCRGCNADSFVFPAVKTNNLGLLDDHDPLPLIAPRKMQIPRSNNRSKGVDVAQLESFSFKSFDAQSTFGAGLGSKSDVNVSTPSNQQKPGKALFFGDNSKPFFGGPTHSLVIGATTIIEPVKSKTFAFGEVSRIFGGGPQTTASCEATKSTSTFSFQNSSLYGDSATAPSTITSTDSSSVFSNTPLSTKENENNCPAQDTSKFSFALSPSMSVIPIAANDPLNVTNSIIPKPNTATNQPTSMQSKNNDEPFKLSLANEFSFAALAAKANDLKSLPPSDFSFTAFAAKPNKSKSGELLLNTDTSLSIEALPQSTTTKYSAENTSANASGVFFGLSNRDTFSNLMSARQSAKNETSTNTNANANDPKNLIDDINYEPHYEPIIALPDEIQASTDEENEEKLFGERAQLFRFNAASKEWKKRGVGELKVLRHLINNSYRLLLRREQVHKLVLNMALSADFQMNAMKQSDKAFCWVANNFVEDTVNCAPESLSVRFKNAQLAQKFDETIQRCIEELQISGEWEPEDD